MSEAALFTDEKTGRQLLLADSARLSQRNVVVSDPASPGDLYLMPSEVLKRDYTQGSGRRRFRRRKGGGR